jgi:GT2 family glycosyltransferase/Flp pilus assembly protein TadD
MLYNRALSVSRKRIFIDKTPRYYYIIPELKKVFPKAKFILLLRNPLAVLSSVLHTWFENKPEALIKSVNYLDVIKGPFLLSYGIKLLREEAIIVKYEDLVKNTENTIKGLCAKLGIIFQNEMLVYREKQKPNGRFGDSVGINKHVKAVSNYIDRWVVNLQSPTLYEFSMKYLETLGPDLFDQLGYRYEEIKSKIEKLVYVSHDELESKQSSASKKPQKTLSENLKKIGKDENTKDNVLISAVVSTYNSEEYLRNCIEDLEAQTISDRLEIIVVDSASEQNEEAVVTEFQKKYKNIKYIKTNQRETIYQAWNRGIKASSGKYITNANTDDRHRIDAFERLAAELEKNPDIGLVYADVFVTNFANQVFGEHIHCGYHIRPEYSKEIMLSGCHMGPQPMWRKSIHESVGYFSDEYQSAGDYDFWCRVALNFPMKHVPELLGLYYENPKGFCNSKKALSIRETVSIQKKYQGSFPVPGKTEKYINNYQFPQYVKDKKYVNISMVTYNRLNFTIQSIESILKSTRYPFVITVIDNNSSDGTKEYLAELHRKGIIKNLVILEENVGVAKASNLAWYLEQHAEYYLKFDNDIVIKKADWLFNMVKAIDAIPELGAIAYNFEPYSYPLSTMNGVKCRIKKHNNLGGACILIPKRTREQLGFWCEDFGLYGEEDADYGERIRLKGLLNAYMKDENIGIHLPGGRAARIDPKTLNAHDGAEEIIHSEYRQWKDNIRRQIIASGVFKNRVEGYRKGQYPLNIESEFTKEFLAKQNSMKQANETGLEIELATPPNSIQTSNPTHSIKTSIIIVTYNSSTDIKKCLESITKNTHRTYEIIIIDNCSSDGTREFLKTLEKVNIILNPVNLGFSKGCNQGIEAAKGEYIVLLNPDTVVTDKWDEKLISHFNDSVGAVGPLSNYVAGRQKYEFYTKERLATLENVDSFSKNIYHQNKGKNRETKLLIGFCMMIKREVIDAVGMLDETLFLGNDDLDLSLRLRNRGYRLLVAIDTFIYHKGQASFDSEPKEKTDALVQESTNTLYQKLKEQYGDGRIPNSQELWDIGWFKPNQQVHQKNGLTSVIILTYNQLKYTVKCIESIFKYTSKSFEIIIVDNGSSDGTVEYLESEVLGRNTAVRVKIIKNIENKGFAGGNNQGIAAAAGDYILLLNNDVVVTPGWLELLINCAERNSKIGIVGPRSNYVSGPQLVKEVSYDTATLKGLSEYVNRFVDSYSGQVQRVLRVVGFCMLIKRTVIEKIGGLDDRYGLGNFEDDDLSLRAAIAGFESWIAKDCFIHHFGSRTFIGANLDFSKSLHNNWEIFKKKWGLPEDLPYGSPYRMSQMSISGFDSAKHYIPLPKQDDAAKMVENDFQDPAKMYHDLLSKLSTCGPEDVLKDLERFVSSYPAFALAHNDLGVLCYNTGLKEKAVHHYQKAVQLDPNNISFQKNLADFYYVELRRVEDALQIYVNILETHPKDVETLLAIGCICSALGKFDDAIDFYKRVLEIEPGNEDAKENLEALKNYQIHGKTQLSHGGGIFQDSIRENITDADPSKAYDQGFSVSIIIGLDGVQNRLKECVDSIRQHTFEPHEIIFIDDGATKGIQKWVQRMVADNPNYRFLKVGKKIGWPAAINRGLSAASGEFVAILQNDVVVSEGWLSDMLECIHRKPNIAVVGPMINDAEGIQKAIHVNCCSMDDFDAASKKFRKLNRHRRVPVTNLSSCCLLFRKEVLGDIGLLDESFSTEEMAVKNFCIRASYHGYRNFIAADVLVYHTNRHQTTKGRAEIDPAKVRDRKVFKEKLNALEMKNEVGRQLQMLKILEQAEELNQKGQVDRAIDTLLHGIGLKAEDRRCYLALAEILIKAKRFQGALDALNEMPNSNKSETAYSGNGGKRREDDLHSTLLHPTTMHQQDLRKLELCGYCEEGLENLGKAQNHADRVLALNPSSAPALNLKGILAYKRNDKKSAEAYFSKALESDPSYGEAYTNLGTIQWEEGQGREALSNYERGFILDPTDLEIATIYHSAVAALGEFERAQSFVQDAAGLHPPNKKIKYMLIDILTRQGKFSEAINEIEEAVAKFGIEDGILDAALKIRDKLGPIQVKKPLTRPAVSLCMIVKNEEHYLAKCLASAEPVVDEMIVVDTGSTDRTKDIAKVFGAQVYDFKWGEDFAEARNFSISKASGDWIFIMDGDEVLSSLDYEGFKNIVKKRPEGPIAYSIVTRNYCTLANSVGWVSNDGKYEREEASIGWIPSAKVRLFYGRDRICFEGAVHEMVEPVLKRNGIPIKHCNLPIHHYGRLDKEKLESKGEKYFEIGKKKLEAMGDDISAVRELAVQAAALGKNEEAIGLWQRFLSLDPSPVLASEAFINLGTIYSRLEKYDDALLASKKALELTPDVKEAHNNFALGKFYLGNVEEAIPIFEKLLKQFPEYLSAQFKLAAAYCSNGQKEKGKKTFEMLRQTTKMGHAEMAGACHDLAKGLASAQRLDYAIGLLNASIENNYINDDLLTLLTECLKQGNSLGS